jgi:ribonuclease D
MEVPGTTDLFWIARTDELLGLADELQRHAVIGVDTESNSLFAYREQVCLLQVSTEDKDYLIDPLALNDLTPLAPVFLDPDIKKIFHAAEYDMICLKRDFDFEFTNLFDTMLAARILGRSALGLGSLIEEEFGLQVDKRYQRANWTRRPITPAMMNYARMDTRYLIPLADILRKQLEKSGRQELAEEDFQRLTQIAAGSHENGSSGFWRVSGSQDLTPRQAAVLQELCNYRDNRARASNQPPFRILSNQTLLELAQRMPRKRGDLNQVTGLSPKMIDRHASGLLSAVERGIVGPPAYRPYNQRPSDDLLWRLDQLRNWRKLTAREMGVESDIVLPRDVMEAIALRDPRTTDDLVEVMRDLPWRLQHFGNDIIHLLNH